mgnify:FL=1
MKFKFGDAMHSSNILGGLHEVTIVYPLDGSSPFAIDWQELSPYDKYIADVNANPLKYIIGTIDEYKDGLLLDKKTCNFEVKSLSKYYHHYITQLEYYKVLLELVSHHVDRVALWFWDKTNEKDYLFSTDEDTLTLRKSDVVKEEMLARAGLVVEALTSRVLPPRSVGEECNFCPHFGKCFTGEGVW